MRKTRATWNPHIHAFMEFFFIAELFDQNSTLLEKHHVRDKFVLFMSSHCAKQQKWTFPFLTKCYFIWSCTPIRFASAEKSDPHTHSRTFYMSFSTKKKTMIVLCCVMITSKFRKIKGNCLITTRKITSPQLSLSVYCMSIQSRSNSTATCGGNFSTYFCSSKIFPQVFKKKFIFRMVQNPDLWYDQCHNFLKSRSL